jgi:hypothetical protein
MIQQLPMCYHALVMLRQVDEYEYKVDFRLKPGTLPARRSSRRAASRTQSSKAYRMLSLSSAP